LLALATVSGALFASLATAADSGPKVRLSQVSLDTGVDAGEGWIAVDPTDPNTVVVDWLATSDVTQQNGGDANASPANLTRGYCGVARSVDGGASWSRKQLQWAADTQTVGDPVNVGPVPGPHSGNRNFPICGDPVLGVNPRSGAMVAAAAQIASAQLEQAETSTDNGWTWSNPNEVFGLEQTLNGAVGNLGNEKTIPIGPGRAWMAVDPQTGVASINSQEDGGLEGRYLVVSHDDGATWGTPRPLDPDVQGSTAGMHGSAFGILGVAYNVNPGSPEYQAPSSACSQGCRGEVTCPPNVSPCTVFETTQDDGLTWTRYVMPLKTAAGTKIVAADPIHKNRFAVLVSQPSTNGAELEVWLTNDGGKTWTGPSKTITPPATGVTLIKPAIQFSTGSGTQPSNGAVGIVWRTVYADTSYDVSAVVSPDGGTKWKDPVKLTVKGAAPPWNQMSDDCACNIAMTNHSLLSVWGDGRTGSRQLWLARYYYDGIEP
jgi:hypothetical protein